MHEQAGQTGRGDDLKHRVSRTPVSEGQHGPHQGRGECGGGIVQALTEA